MHEKKGNKTDRTVSMENLVEKYFLDEYGITLTREKKIGKGRADLSASIDDNKDVIVCEIKQSINDFYSGNGLNLSGISNYIAVPSDLVGFCIWFSKDTLNRTDIGVIEVTDSGTVRTVIYPNPYTGNEFRKIGLIEAQQSPWHIRK